MPDITGRDGYLIAEALALAIETMRPWPKSYRPESNIADMQKLLVARVGPDDAQVHLERQRAILKEAVIGEPVGIA